MENKQKREMAAAIAALRAFRKSSICSSSSPCFPPLPTFSSQSIRRLISTLIVAEHEGGFLKPSSLSALAAAEAVSKANSISVLLAGFGPSVEKAAQHAATCHPSVSEVLVAKSEELEYPMAESWAEIVKLAQNKGNYSHIMAASTSFGKNVLPRAAALLDVSPITDVVQISEPRLFVRPIYAGNALCTVRYMGQDPCVMTVRSTSFQVDVNPDAAKENPATITQIDISSLNQEIVGKSKWLNLSSQESERPDLANARVVVTGGRALKSAENFKLLEKLAEKLGAAVGATRAAVDAGFVPNDLQVGQTGKIVAPELYIAFGVSGAIQHLAGMRDSKFIVAVNKDADAPIFQVADYGLVADLFEVLPELLEKLPGKLI